LLLEVLVSGRCRYYKHVLSDERKERVTFTIDIEKASYVGVVKFGASTTGVRFRDSLIV
jgi:hypothetical protein